MPEQILSIPYPPQEVYKNGKSQVQKAAEEESPVFEFDHAIYSDSGIFAYKKGLMYPERGMPTPHQVAASNVVKRFLVATLKSFAVKEAAIFIAFFSVFRYQKFIKALDRWCNEFTDAGGVVLDSYYYNPMHYADSCRALRQLVGEFLNNLGVSRPDKMGELVCHLFESDSAYRYRLEDICGVTTKELIMENPRREIKKMFEKLVEREKISQTVIGKAAAIARLCSYGLLHPKIKRAFVKAVEATDWKALQLDMIDRYHCLRMDGYDFWGASTAERIKEYVLLHNGQPPIPKTLKQRQEELQQANGKVSN